MANSPQQAQPHARCFGEARTRGTGSCSRKAWNILRSSSAWELGGSRKQVRSSEAAVVLVPGAQGLVGDLDNSTWPSLIGFLTEVGVG